MWGAEETAEVPGTHVQLSTAHICSPRAPNEMRARDRRIPSSSRGHCRIHAKPRLGLIPKVRHLNLHSHIKHMHAPPQMYRINCLFKRAVRHFPFLYHLIELPKTQQNPAAADKKAAPSIHSHNLWVRPSAFLSRANAVAEGGTRKDDVNTTVQMRRFYLFQRPRLYKQQKAIH